MARSNGPFGPAATRPPARRHPTEDPFAAPPPAQSNGQWPPQQSQGYHFPPEPDPNFGYDQQPPAAFDRYQGAPQQWGQPDPRAYDLGNYMPSGGPQSHPPMDPPPFHHSTSQDPYAQPGYADPEAEYDDEFADEDEPRRGRRWMLIVAALVGAVGVGGALAYTYKSFVAPSSRVPLVKAVPKVKVRPESRPAAADDKRMQGRLGDESGRQNTASAAPETTDDRGATDDPAGPRRVRTIPITPGGGQPPGIQVTPPPSVPGIMLENVGPRATPQAPPKAAPPPARVTIGQPPPSVSPPPQREGSSAPLAKKAPPPPPQVAAKAPPPPPRAAPTSGSGYVAVLSSQRSRMDALKAFADLQQKYSEALSGKVPDVQEADLGQKGIWYRVVIGPPGSRDAANGVCSQLRTAGYSHCWINAY